MKKLIEIAMSLLMLMCLVSCKDASLPKPETEEGMRGQLGIDKNINEKTIDEYLNRADSVYRDMRMLKDEADYEAIGGDSYLSGYVKGFEVVPYPYLCNVEGLPEEVGEAYSGPTLFTLKDGEYVANYEESLHIIESLFPRDKYIFLMCGGGGYAGMTKELLVGLGYDGDRIYNTGGYWYYEGKNKVETFYEDEGKTHYDFSNVPYHVIDHSVLTPVDGYDGNNENKEESPSADEELFIPIEDTAALEKLEKDRETFAVYVYLPGCSSCASFYPFVKQFVTKNDIRMYSADLSDFFRSKNSISDRVSYTPSMFIYVDGEVVAYLDPGSDDDLPYYQSLEGLTEWFTSHLDVELIGNDRYECESACSIE